MILQDPPLVKMRESIVWNLQSMEIMGGIAVVLPALPQLQKCFKMLLLVTPTILKKTWLQNITLDHQSLKRLKVTLKQNWDLVKDQDNNKGELKRKQTNIKVRFLEKDQNNPWQSLSLKTLLKKSF